MKNKIQDAFEPIRAEDSLKRKTIAEISAKKRPVKGVFRRSVVLAMLLLLAVVSFGGYRVYYTPVDVISIDINPSVELNINRFERVISWKSFVPESEDALSGLSLKHRNYEDAVSQVLQSSFILLESTEVPYVRLTVASGSSQRRQRILTSLEETYLPISSMLVECREGAMENLGEAHRHGMSLGRYSTYLELSGTDQEVTIEEAREMRMLEIRERMQKMGPRRQDDRQQRKRGQ
ncbi:MAG TPA: hypothetical protein GX733_09040 [Tissierellia bacterium]|nr:hypothetical protein [Tissierellia bacterium]